MPVPLPRRRLILQMLSGGLLGAAGLGTAGVADTVDPRANPRFLHGVASGDPLADRVVLWTRITPNEDWHGEIPVDWRIAEDPGMRRLVGNGRLYATESRDYTLKVDVPDLRPGHTYFYQFQAGAEPSPIGRTRTLPDAGVSQVRFAAFSCSNYPAGYFHVFADAAKRDDLDAVLHLGDYIYEYGKGGYATQRCVELDRIPQPLGILMTLHDYRARYAQYHRDQDLQALHASVPFITVWDDHEFADDTWSGGACDHDESKSPFAARRAAAVQAYHEWLPIRMPDATNPDRIYRSFDFGKLVSLHMLDTRLIGRDRPVNIDDFRDQGGRLNVDAYKAAVADPARNMIGPEQLAWLEDQVARSKARWQVLGQQVLMANMAHPQSVIDGQLSMPELQTLRELERSVPERLSEEERAYLKADALPWYLDCWDGYAAERERVFDIMRKRGKNLVVLAGDTHNAWAADLFDAQNRRVGVEFATSSVSSPGLETCFEMAPVDIAAMYRDTVPALRYAETARRGYLVITATQSELTCDYHFVDRTDSRQFTATLGKTLRTLPGPSHRTILDA